MPRDILHAHNPEFQKVVDHLRSDISTLRTGRAHPAILDAVTIEAYDSRQGLAGLASINVPDARTIIVEPWDKSILKNIEKGIQEANLNLNPVVQGTQIRLTLPMLTEENRRGLVKVLGEKLEHARKSIRNVRETAKTDVLKGEKDGELSEDEKYKMLEQLDKTAAGMNDRIKHIGEEKEAEIMTI